MSAVIDPTTPAANDAPALLPAIVSLKTAALAKFTPTEIQLRALAEKYRDCAYDVSTLKGLGDAKAARHELRESGRYVVQRVRDATKDDLNALKGTVEAEAERLISLIAATEKAIDEQIKAREQQLADEKRAREQAEAARVTAHQGELAKIRGYVQQAQGKTAAELDKALGTLRDLCRGFDAGAWEEFATEAAQAWADTLATLERLHTEVRTREEDAARVEAQRLENVRIAAELEARQRAFDAQVAQRLAEQRALQAEADERERRPAHEIRSEAAPAPEADKGTAVTPAPSEREAAPTRPVITVDLGATKPIDLPPPATPPTLRLGAIVQRLRFKVDADFLTSIGCAPAGRAGAAVLYHEHDFPALCAKLAEHVLKVAEQHA